MAANVNETIRKILGQQNLDVGKLADEADLYGAGLTSFAAVQIMLRMEEEFGVEFPERMLNRKTFSSISHLQAAVTELLSEQGATQ